MFPPDADVAPYNAPNANAAEEAKGPPKAIKHGNTRLPEQDDKPDHSLTASSSPTWIRVDAAVTGTLYMRLLPLSEYHALS